MRVLFALPGLHRHDRGAEVAFVSIATGLSKLGHSVTLIGSGPPRPESAYEFQSIKSTDRTKFERFPKLPIFRNEYVYEELSYCLGLLSFYDPSHFDVTVTCSYPFTNWLLTRRTRRKVRPSHVYVTQNGDWPPRSNDLEYRYFNCDGLVCTNPDFFEANKRTWNCRLIPNGVDLSRFTPGSPMRSHFDLPVDKPIILMVSALIPSKRVALGIEAVSKVPEAHLVIAGDGPLRSDIDKLASSLLPNRYTRLSIAADAMPSLYRSVDVFLHLSLLESFGNVFLEALATGLPIVGHDTPRLRWIVGDQEHLVDSTSVERVTDALLLALEDPPSRRRSRISASQRFSWEAIAQQYEEFLQEVAGFKAHPFPS